MHTHTNITYEYIIWYQYGHDNISKFWTIILNCLKELASLNGRLKSIYVKKLEAFTLQLLHGSWTTWPGLKLMRFCQRHIAHMSHISRNVWRIQSSKLIYSTIVPGKCLLTGFPNCNDISSSAFAMLSPHPPPAPGKDLLKAHVQSSLHLRPSLLWHPMTIRDIFMY